MSDKIALSYIICGDVDGGTYRNHTEVQANNCDVTILKGPVSLRRTTYLTPNRLEMTFNYRTEVAISFEMARALLIKLKDMDLEDDEPEENE